MHGSAVGAVVKDRAGRVDQVGDVVESKKYVSKALDSALDAQQPVASRQVQSWLTSHPGDSPRDMIKRLNRMFLTTVTASGGAAGAGGAVPGVGLPAALADMVAFTTAATMYTLARAEIHGLSPDDLERRRLLVLTVLLGDTATKNLHKGTSKMATHWAKAIVEKIPMTAINKANKFLGPHFITKYGTKQGVLVLSKQVPLGLGVGLGAGGNHLVGRFTIKSADKIFGPPPERWPHEMAGTIVVPE